MDSRTSNSSRSTSEDMARTIISRTQTNQMLSVFTQLLPRTSVRCFATRAAIWNAFSPGYAVQGTQSGPYANVNIDGDTSGTWKNNPIGDSVVEPVTLTPEEIWRENSKNTVPMLQHNPRMADAYQGLLAFFSLECFMSFFQDAVFLCEVGISRKP